MQTKFTERHEVYQHIEILTSDEGAFERLRATARRREYRSLRGGYDAEDLLQEAFQLALESPERWLPEEESFADFIVKEINRISKNAQQRVKRNAAARAVTRSADPTLPDPLELVPSPVNEEKQVQVRLDLDKFWPLLARYPNAAQVFWFWKAEGCTACEIQQCLGIDVDAQARTRRWIARLAVTYAKHNGSPRVCAS